MMERAPHPHPLCGPPRHNLGACSRSAPADVHGRHAHRWHGMAWVPRLLMCMGPKPTPTRPAAVCGTRWGYTVRSAWGLIGARSLIGYRMLHACMHGRCGCVRSTVDGLDQPIWGARHCLFKHKREAHQGASRWLDVHWVRVTTALHLPYFEAPEY